MQENVEKMVGDRWDSPIRVHGISRVARRRVVKKLPLGSLLKKC
jgi:hypothetical protein